MAQITLEQVTKEFSGGVRAVDEVDLTIESGEFLVLVGPSGCGKSTLLRMIAGLEEVTDGRIEIVPSVISSSPAIIRSADVLPQPDGPTKTTSSPSSMSSSSSWTARVPSG